jgi:hypothetical protein
MSMTREQINALLKSAALDATTAACRRYGLPAPVLQDNRPPEFERVLADVRAQMEAHGLDVEVVV